MCLEIQSRLGSMFKNPMVWSMVLLNIIKNNVFFKKRGTSASKENNGRMTLYQC